LCPELIFLDHNFKKYKEKSIIFKNILAEYDPEFESMGLDEANIDATSYLIKNNMNTDEGR
jgi:DNA polymerase kappa